MSTTQRKETEWSMIPQEWKILKLGEIYNDFNNKRIPLSSMDRQKRQWPYPYYWANGPIDYIDDYIFDWEYLLIWEDGSVIKDNGKPYTQLVNWKFRCSNHAHVLQAKQEKIYSTKFLKYLLDNTDIRHVVTWAVQPKLNKWNLQSISFWIPTLLEQQAIASVLGSLDDKIELLREQNRNLETIGQAIFKEWFVNFNYPWATGEFENSELGMIPKWWRVEKLGDIDFIKFGDGNYSSKYPKSADFIDSGIPFISNRDISDGIINSNNLRYISLDQHNTLKKGHLKKGDILISTRANIGDIALVSEEFEWANINAQLVFIRAREPAVYSNFLYTLFSSEKYKEIFESFSSGSAQKQLPMHALRKVGIIIPSHETMIEFSKIVGPVSENMQQNICQIQSLKKTRDSLLPRLMSGKVRVFNQ